MNNELQPIPAKQESVRLSKAMLNNNYKRTSKIVQTFTHDTREVPRASSRNRVRDSISKGDKKRESSVDPLNKNLQTSSAEVRQHVTSESLDSKDKLPLGVTIEQLMKPLSARRWKPLTAQQPNFMPNLRQKSPGPQAKSKKKKFTKQ